MKKYQESICDECNRYLFDYWYEGNDPQEENGVGVADGKCDWCFKSVQTYSTKPKLVKEWSETKICFGCFEYRITLDCLELQNGQTKSDGCNSTFTINEELAKHDFIYDQELKTFIPNTNNDIQSSEFKQTILVIEDYYDKQGLENFAEQSFRHKRLKIKIV